MQEPRPQPETAGPPSYKAAPFEARLFAFLIDLSLLGCVYALLVYLTWSLYLKNLPLALDILVSAFCLSVAIFLGLPFLLTMIYFSFLHALMGKTIGKMFMGIQVVSSENGLLSPGRAFLRWVGYLLSAIPGAAGFFWSMIDRSHDTWHDKLAGSHVISREMT
jgi:uncharacterized RDD family membrane protein YckC